MNSEGFYFTSKKQSQTSKELNSMLKKMDIS